MSEPDIHTKTRNELEQAGTTWNELELSRQASAFEACDRTRTPLHTPKALQTC